ncbi:nudC domain-containing protein 1 [Aricia agestis]|uniref:nudC domain-containing protein 1 n=1 Tax=Aricia agestis TaxID=91739 RepID=UPI001C20871D|nr:nudC domain-containing protein 1 [Aricia agestis]
MPSCVIELRCDRRLLDHEFEGYKLNLQALPQHKLDLISSVDKVYPDDIQYSFIHARLFALHNHLIVDKWDPRFSFYYVDKQQQIRNVTFENINNTFQSGVVYTITNIERRPGHFNIGVIFPSPNLVVITDGTGYLHIVSTGARNGSVSESWKTLHSTLALGENKCYTILDSRLQENNEVEFLHCLLQSVEQTDKQFNSVLSWVTFSNDGIQWRQSLLRQVQGKGIVHYGALETDCTALYVASNNMFKVTHDSEKEIVVKTPEAPTQIIYTWMQTTEDISITLKLENKFNKKHLIVSVTPLTIKVTYAGKDYVNGKLKHSVDSELTTWNIQENGQVDILITKSESKLWDELIENGDKTGEQILDPSLIAQVHERLSHLCSETEVTDNDQSLTGFNAAELEECDAASEEDTVLTRIDIIKHEVTHRIPLSVNQYLFHINLEPHQAPALCLRHDVDACIWQPYAQLINTETWPVKHIGTLLAFGYVQSSKQNRKFTACSPNFSYSVVCEASRHIFIYRHSGNRDCQLRRRTGGQMQQVKVGMQHVVNIDSYGEVLGVEATNEYLFILTENTLLVIGIH